MSWATRIAAGGQAPVYILEFDGDEIEADEFDAATNWSAGNASVTGITTNSTDAKSGTASIQWDKSGTGAAAGNIINSSMSFSLSDYAYHSIRFKMPTTLTGTAQNFVVALGQDGSNFYFWNVPVALLSEGQWVTLRLSLNEADSGYTSTGETGSPSPTGIVWCSLNYRGTDASFTYSGARADLLMGHPYRYSTAKVTTPRADTLQGHLVAPPSISPHRYNPITGSLGSASASCRVVDRSSDSAVLADFAAYAESGRGCTWYMGFRGDAETDDNYQPIFRGIMQNARHAGKAWDLTISDNLQRLRRPFAQSATEGSPFTISGNILTVILQLGMSTGNGNNNATYDVLTAAQGAGISQDLFDVSDIEDVRGNYMGSDDCSFTFTESQRSFLDWILKEGAMAFGVAPIIRGDGTISFRAVESGVYPTATITDLGTSNIITGSIPPFELDNERIRNQIRILYDWNSSTEVFDSDSGSTYQNADSIALYGLRELVIESKGIASATVAARVATRILTYLGNGAPPVKLKGFNALAALENGELVTITMDRIIPDLEAATYGMATKRGAIEVRGFNPGARSGGGEVELDVALTSYQANPYRLISGLSVDYDSATAAQQAVYAWIADGSDQLGSANDPAHVIGPG